MRINTIRWNKIRPERVFWAGSIFCFCILMICIFMSRGQLWNNFFWGDSLDSGMDFFHSIEYVRGRVPYEKFSTLYPPLANLFFFVIYYFIPREISQNWADEFIASIGQRGTIYDLRIYQSCMMVFILFVVASTFCLVVLCNYYLNEKRQSDKILMSLGIICSYGVLYAYERGNIIVIALACSLFFVAYYNSTNKIVRELALIALAIAAGLKLYPAFLGILLLRNKEYREAIRCIIYGIVSIVFPMFIFKEGINGFAIWIKTVFDFGNSNMVLSIGNSLFNIEYHSMEIINRIIPVPISESILRMSAYAVVIIILICAMVQKEEWKAILLAILAMVLFQNQGDYILCMFLIPLLAFCRDKEYVEKENWVPYIALLVLTWCIPVFTYKEVSYPRNALSQVAMLVLVFWSIGITIKEKWKCNYERN